MGEGWCTGEKGCVGLDVVWGLCDMVRAPPRPALLLVLVDVKHDNKAARTTSLVGCFCLLNLLAVAVSRAFPSLTLLPPPSHCLTLSHTVSHCLTLLPPPSGM
jgi:hypothetical protein